MVETDLPDIRWSALPEKVDKYWKSPIPGLSADDFLWEFEEGENSFLFSTKDQRSLGEDDPAVTKSWTLKGFEDDNLQDQYIYFRSLGNKLITSAVLEAEMLHE